MIVNSNLWRFEKKFLAMNIKQQHRFLYKILAVAALSFFIGLMIMDRLDKEVLPKVDQGQFIVKVNMPVGTKLEVTDEMAELVEKQIMSIEDVLNTAVSIGSSKGEGAEGGVGGLLASQAQILVNLKPERKRSSLQVLDMIKDTLDGLAQLKNAEIDYILQESEFAAGAAAKPVAVQVQGYDYEVMRGYVEKIQNKLRLIRGVYGVQNDLAQPSPETKVDIDRRKAALYGVSVKDISLTAKAAIDGAVPTTFKAAGREIDIRVRLKEDDRNNLQKLGELLIMSPVLESEVALKEVATITRGFGPSEIRRQNQSRTIMVTANLEEKADKQKILDDVVAFLKDNFKTLPEGYSIGLSGEAIEVKDAFTKIVFALILSIVLTYMIMASQFESLIQPLIIMFTVPLAIIGVAIALFISHTSLNAISLLGLILLGGVVVNNGIVLIEYVNQRRAAGEDVVVAAIRTSQIRARPIAMTAVSSMVGSLPLALGFGGASTAIQAPMAIAIIGGLFSSTLLTLFVIPSVYILTERFIARIMDKFYGSGEEEEEDDAAAYSEGGDEPTPPLPASV